MIRRFFILAALGYVLYWLIRRSLRQPSSDRSKEEKEKKAKIIDGGEMVKDPMCLTYYPKNKAIPRKIEDEVHYFCSGKCLEKYLEKVKAGSSSGA
jgi:YHS domain-containing protein